jgi:hypothetical protein
MRVIFFLGPVSFLLAGALFYWGSTHSSEGGYGAVIIALLLYSLFCGIFGLRSKPNRWEKIVSWLSIFAPIVFLFLITLLLAGLSN